MSGRTYADTGYEEIDVDHLPHDLALGQYLAGRERPLQPPGAAA